MKTSELTGATLDWAVAKCEGITENKDSAWYYDRRDAYNYSTNWSHGGPIIEREQIAVFLEYQNCWCATDGDRRTPGDTPLIAAMRCYVASKLGDDVDVPKELQP